MLSEYCASAEPASISVAAAAKVRLRVVPQNAGLRFFISRPLR